MARFPLTSTTWSRRGFLGAGVAGAAYLTLGGIPAGAAEDDLSGKTLNLVLRYRTDPNRIARALPPGLEPDEVAEVTVDWFLRYPGRNEENIYFPGPYTESGIHVTAKYQGHRGMFQIGMPLDQNWGRVRGRESTGLVKKEAELSLGREGDIVRADLKRRGKLLYRIETEIVDRPAHPLFWHRETGYGAFLYRYRLHPDWRQGPLGDDPVELWLRVLGGRTGWYPEEMVEGGPRQCDIGKTHFEFVEPSPLDPFIEFPMVEIVGLSYRETGLAVAAERSYRGPGTQSRIERLQLIDKRLFEPWALYRYDRPITAGEAWTPPGWPEQSTALKLTGSELERYREREALVLEPVGTLDLQLRIDASMHRKTLPPQLEPGDQPHIRILALQVERSDISTQPFNELWLLSRCLHDGRPVWYALSHIAGLGGDVVNGRETFGYPSKTGTVVCDMETDRFSISAARLGREVLRCSGTVVRRPTRQGVAPRLDDQFEIIGLRQHPPYREMTLHGFTEPGPRLELIAQAWSFDLIGIQLGDPSAIALELPRAPGPGVIGAPDPWYEFAAGEIVKASYGRGALRRSPGRSLGSFDGLQPFYLERWDGAQQAALAISGEAQHTFQIED